MDPDEPYGWVAIRIFYVVTCFVVAGVLVIATKLPFLSEIILAFVISLVVTAAAALLYGVVRIGLGIYRLIARR